MIAAAKSPASDAASRIHIEFRPVSEWSDGQIQSLIDAGRREAELLTELEEAVANDDRELAWQISQAIYEESRKR